MAEKTTKPPVRKKSAVAVKQELLDTVAETQKLLEETRESKPEERIEARAIAAAVATADELSAEGVLKSITELRASVGKLLVQLADKLDAEVEKFGQVKKAIAAKEKELAEIYEIQRSATTLAALIESQQRKREDFDTEMAAAKEELSQEIDQTRTAWESERKGRETQQKEFDAAEQKRRAREKEEYQYAFAREQQLTRDKFEDEMEKQQRELADTRQQQERELAGREKALAGQEADFAQLRQRVENFPKELDAATARTAKESSARAESDAKSREELLKRDFAGERNVLTTRIAGLEHTVTEQSEQLARLSQQSEKAYAQVQDIAVRAIEGSATQKSLMNLQQLLAEQSRRSGENK